MEPSELQRILLAAASTSFANLLDFEASFNKKSDGDVTKQCFSIEEEAKKKVKCNNNSNND